MCFKIYEVIGVYVAFLFADDPRSRSSGCQTSLTDGTDNCGRIRATISRLTLTHTHKDTRPR